MYACGQCLPCRVNKSRLWTHRIILESLCHEHSTFLTLTYDDNEVPKNGEGRDTLKPKDVQDFLKRIRKHHAPFKLRYFSVGEYGDKTERPHYHIALFGYQTCLFGRTRNYRKGGCCRQCDTVRDIWGKGGVDLGTLNTESASYISGYVVKKMTNVNDKVTKDWLQGRYPEFARMSLKPGIGAHFIPDLAHTLMSLGLDETQVDVPSTLRHGKRTMPLGRYLTRQLRKQVGRDETTPQEVLDKVEEELRPLREKAFENSTSFKEEVVKAGDTKVLQMEKKLKLFRKGRTI